MGKPKKDKKTEATPKNKKEQTLDNEVTNDILEEMKNVSMMSPEEISEIPSPVIDTQKKNNTVELQEKALEEKVAESDAQEEKESTIEESQHPDEQDITEIQKTIETIGEQKEIKETVINKNNIAPKRNRNAREMYGYDWCGLCYDD